ncbi:uncharacterized protein DS421_10g300140 [Arachis hypogaea]|nr:uncharacterized protein DS421_10g300140 [Arachis hypogaea]
MPPFIVLPLFIVVLHRSPISPTSALLHAIILGLYCSFALLCFVLVSSATLPRYHCSSVRHAVI